MKHAMTRREFLAKGATLIGATLTIPQFLARTAAALTPAPGSGVALERDRTILVVVQLGGGNDGLNTLIPWRDDAYYKARPTLAIPPSASLKLTDELALHPQMAPVKSHYEEGRVAIIQGVGYPNPNRSHFRSMEIWETGRPDSTTVRTGWLGRYFDNECSGCDEPTVGVAVGSNLPQAMRSERGAGVTVSDPAAYLGERDEPLVDPRTAVADAFKKLLGLSSPGNQALDFLRRTTLNSTIAEDQIRAALSRYRGSVEYPPTAFGQRMRLIAQLIGGGLPTRVYYANLTGFDTHASQGGRHDLLLQELSHGLDAFLRDIRALGESERVLVMTFSEFGRRVAENGSGGTDHGAAAPMFLLGDPLKAGLFGKTPSLTDLDRGDLKYNVDFRSVYATVLEKWLGADSRAILGGSFDTLPFLV